MTRPRSQEGVVPNLFSVCIQLVGRKILRSRAGRDQNPRDRNGTSPGQRGGLALTVIDVANKLGDHFVRSYIGRQIVNGGLSSP